MQAAQAVDAHQWDLRLVTELGEPVTEPLTVALLAPPGRPARDQLLVRRAVLCECEQVGPEQRWHFERAARSFRLADVDPQQTPIVVQIAHGAIGNFRRAHPQEQRREHADSGVVADVRLRDAQIDELTGFVDAELLLAAVALADGRDVLERIHAQPALLHAPLAEALRLDETVAMRIDGDVGPRMGAARSRC
ncbi:MAG TPA: hypothetical protein VGG74_19400 [Kofleriaceae bacterium]